MNNDALVKDFLASIEELLGMYLNSLSLDLPSVINFSMK